MRRVWAWDKMTVPQLREECRRRKLPVYQCAGKRLRKADLVAQLGKGRGARGEKKAKRGENPRNDKSKTADSERRTPNVKTPHPRPLSHGVPGRGEKEKKPRGRAGSPRQAGKKNGARRNASYAGTKADAGLLFAWDWLGTEVPGVKTGLVLR